MERISMVSVCESHMDPYSDPDVSVSVLIVFFSFSFKQNSRVFPHNPVTSEDFISAKRELISLPVYKVVIVQ